MDNNNWDLYAVVRGCCTAVNNNTTTTITTASNNNNTSHLDGFVGLPSFVGENKDENSVGFLDLFEELHAICMPFLPDYQALSQCSAASPMSSSSLSSIFEELHAICMPFLPDYQALSQCSAASPMSSSSLGSIFASENITQRVPEKRKITTQAVSFAPTTADATHTTTAAATHNCAFASAQPPRSKRRKNQHKTVCHVSADALSSDIWAWRKYGKKTIKGSPHPRGYYKCSSSKSCMARKQVERNKSNPTMFIVTYTGEHDHPAPTQLNLLAGSTRQQPNTPQAASGANMPERSFPTASQLQQPSSSSPANSVYEKHAMKTKGVKETFEEDDNEHVDASDTHVDGSDTTLSDDFFEGLEDFVSPIAGDQFTDHFLADFEMNWVLNDTAAAGGGC